MAALKTVALDWLQAGVELQAFKELLDGPGAGDLGEAEHILPLFDACEQLCALVGTYNFDIIDYQQLSIAREFSIFGDHQADLVVGDVVNRQFCFVEFEDAKTSSIFKKTRRSTPDWSTRYEHGFSQLVDWILWIENNRGNTAFAGRFQATSINYRMLLVIGRDRDLSHPALRDRFEWRNEQVVVASRKLTCVTYDKLYRDLSTRLTVFPAITPPPTP